MNRRVLRCAVLSVFGLLIALTNIAWADYQSTILADAPEGYWRLGESSTSQPAADISGNGHTGTYNLNSTVTVGVPGLINGDANTAMHNAGPLTNPQWPVAIPNAAALQFTTSLTMEAWVNLDPPGVGPAQSFIGKPASYMIGLYPSPGAVAAIRIGGASYWCFGPDILDARTHYVAGTFDGSNLRLYVDGLLVNTCPALGSVDVNTRDLYMGAAENDNILSGTLDEAAVYSSVLSAAQIAAHYQAGTGFTPTPTKTPMPMPTPTPPAPTNKDQCKDGGWKNFTVPRSFTNQGDCVRFVNTGK